MEVRRVSTDIGKGTIISWHGVLIHTSTSLLDVKWTHCIPTALTSTLNRTSKLQATLWKRGGWHSRFSSFYNPVKPAKLCVSNSVVENETKVANTKERTYRDWQVISELKPSPGKFHCILWFKHGLRWLNTLSRRWIDVWAATFWCFFCNFLPHSWRHKDTEFSKSFHSWPPLLQNSSNSSFLFTIYSEKLGRTSRLPVQWIFVTRS